MLSLWAGHDLIHLRQIERGKKSLSRELGRREDSRASRPPLDRARFRFDVPRRASDAPEEIVDGKLVLTPRSYSYEAPPWRVRSGAKNAIALYDKAPHHHGGRNVAFTSGAIAFLEEDEFQRHLEADRKRFEK